MPESLGKILKRIRESRNFSIEEVSERSRIPRGTLSIIEEDRLNEIKSSFYAKSFVKTYAAFLGALDETGVKEYLVSGQKKQETVSRPVAAQPVPKTNRGKLAPSQKTPETGLSNISRYKKQILGIVAGVLIFWALSSAIGHVVKFIKNIQAKKQIKSAAVKKEEPKITEKQKPKSAAALKDVKKETASEKSDRVELEISSSDNTWLRVIADGELMFTGSFKKGSKDTWKAKKEIKIEAGNSGAIKIDMNGKPLSFAGKKGEKKEIIITKDGIRN